MPSTKKQIKYIGTKSFEVWRKEKEELCEDLGITNIFKKKTESEMTKLWLYYQKKQGHILYLRKKHKLVDNYYTRGKK